MRRSDLSRDRSEQRSDKFVVGDKVDARITNIDKSNRKLSLSIKAKEIAEEKEAVGACGGCQDRVPRARVIDGRESHRASEAGGARLFRGPAS